MTGTGHPDSGVTDVQAPPPDLLEALSAAWTVLSRLLLHAPGADTLQQVRDPELLNEWPLAGLDPASAAGLELLKRSAELGEDAAAVRRDYNRLFLGPDILRAPPWESVHRSVDGLLFEAETLAVRRWYARHGLAAPRLNREPDDHIGLELEFLATLAQRALTALEENRPAEAQALVADHQAFLTEHVLAWGPAFMDQVRARAETAFYQGVGALGASTLAVAGTLLK